MTRVSLPAWVAFGATLLVSCASGNSAGPTGPTSARPSIESAPSATPAREKLDSRLIDALDRIQAGAPPTSDRNPLDVDSQNRVLVDITAVVSPELLKRIEAANGIVISQFAKYEAIRGRVPFGQLLTLAARPEVKLIRPAEEAITNPRSSGTPSR